MRNADTPAMPTYELNGQGVLEDTSYGLTKREMFAMHAMNGLISSDYKNGSEKMNSEDVALMSVDYADALLAELERKK